jgi:hypothetical protein
MIKKEFFKIREDGVVLYRTYSNANFYIRKVGTKEVYSEAIDVANAQYTYEETDEPIEVNEESKKEEGIIETPEDAEVIEEL